MIEVRSLSRRYGDVLAVDEVSCHIAQGEVVGLLGHNGAGKTTVMKMLTGYLDATAGSITIEGLSMADSRREIQKKIGYLPENCPVYGDMTVSGYLVFRAELMGMSKAEQPAALRQALVRTGLADRALQTIATLSRGLRQRVGVAQAILHQPSIVILDEPTNGLDPTQIQQMRSLIRQLAEHATVMVSTHILSEVEAVCERVLMLSQGKLVLDARLDELSRDASLLLEVDRADDLLVKALSAMDGVQNVSRTDGHILHLKTEGQWQPIAESAASVVHEQKRALRRLLPEVRSLETIFREVNEKALSQTQHQEKQEVAHA
jgi:ABC-2 type transport system ATP-binding protein